MPTNQFTDEEMRRVFRECDADAFLRWIAQAPCELNLDWDVGEYDTGRGANVSIHTWLSADQIGEIAQLPKQPSEIA